MMSSPGNMDSHLFYMPGYRPSTLPSSLCRGLQHRVGSFFCYIIDTRLSIYNIHRRKDLWPETWKWHFAVNIYKHNLLLTSIFWSNSCTSLSGWQLRWTCHHHFIFRPLSPWYCICSGKWSLYILECYLIMKGLGERNVPNMLHDKDFQEAERKIPLNYASRYTSRSGGLQKSAYLPFKVYYSFPGVY